MGKASSSTKVARAARTGRARSRRRSGTSLVWPVSLAAIVVLGTFLVIISRDDTRAEAEPPRLGDHWHAALGFYICNSFLPAQAEFANPQGYHSHGDGLIHLHPTSSEVTGKRATLGKYLELSDIDFSETGFEVPGTPGRENGDKCGDKAGRVRVKINGKVVTEDPFDTKIEDGMIITVAFVPQGERIPDPPSVGNLAAPSDVPGSTLVPQATLPPTSEVTGTTEAPGTTVAPEASTAPPTTGGP